MNIWLELKDKNKKIQTVFVRLSPIMETLTGINGCCFNFLFWKTYG